ncbi:MAG: [protein-PII] uridylyltransferase [Neisseria sp.]|nr:[protein-PII] uridylyltransferase [Neisseria sp.]
MPHAAALAELNRRKQNALDEYRRQRRPDVFFARYSAALDKMFAELYPAFFSDGRFTLLASGGYGRQEMYPCSDVDLVLLTDTPPDEAQQAQITEFVQTLWNMQLAPALKTGTPDELCAGARDDLTADTAFLEARYLCGSRDLADAFLKRLDLQRNPALFIEGKLLEMQQRHDKQQGSGAVLEPNVKTCPGGLRDIHTMIWLAKVQGLKSDVASLMDSRILTRAEAGMLRSSHKQLARIRMDLHIATGREEDRLAFDFQRQIADARGWSDDEGRLKSEKLMRIFYRAAKAVKQLNSIILPMLQGRVYSRLPRIVHDIDADYYQVGNRIASHSLNLFRDKPEHIFKIVELMQQRSDIITIAPKTLRAWWAAAQQMDRRFYKNEANRRRFIGLFRHGSGLTAIMRFLNLYGVLAHYLPAWGKIVGLLQHDLFHIYPVDDHILMVLRNMRRLAMEQHVHEFPFASALMYRFDKPEILYLAALFHDIAKGRGGDHALEGIADARRFAEDHFLDEEDSKLLCWLVEHHLLMSMTAQKEDIQDPEVVRRFCEKIGTPRRLRALYLLTVADIRGTNPKIWNSWKANLLENLFKAAEREFAGENRSAAALTSLRQQEAAAVLQTAGFDAKQQRRLWQALGAAYFVRHEAAEINWHVGFLAADLETPQVHIRPYLDGHTLQVAAFLPNAPRVFARLCRIFGRQQLDILSARAFVSEHDYVLDTFVVQLPEHSTAEDAARIQTALQRELEDFVHGRRMPPESVPQRAGRRARHLPIAPTVQLSAEEDRPNWYTLDIITANRPYLLADIADVFNAHGISLRYAKINTMDARVEDSFLLYSPDLAGAQQQLALKKALLEVAAV